MLTVILLSCDNNEVDAVTPNNTNLEGKLIRSYQVNNKWEYNYKYHEDNSLKEVVFKTDGVVQFTESYRYENGKIIESLKQTADGSNTVKKQYEYKGNLIVKQIEDVNGESLETSYFKYDDNNFLEKITLKGSSKGYEYSKITSIEKIAGENKLRVEREGVATHVISYDDKSAPLCVIPGYKPIVQIENSGISGNILLREIYLGNDCSTVIKADIVFDEDGKSILNSEISYKSKDLDETQEIKYNY